MGNKPSEFGRNLAMYFLMLSFFFFFFVLVSFDCFHIGGGLKLEYALNVNHTVRCEALKAQKEVTPDPDMQIELEDLKQRYKKLKV